MKTSRTVRTAFLIASSLILVAGLMHDAMARGNRGGGGGGGGRGGGGGGGFSRSGPAAGGGFSSQRSTASVGARQAGATQRSGQRTAAAQTGSRQAGSTERSGQRADTQQARTQARADTRTSGQQERTERSEVRQQGQTERTEARQQGQSERTQARANAAQNWDGGRYYYDDHDDDWGYAFAGAAVGATAGFIAGAATATPAPVVNNTYVTVLPCSPAVVTVSGTSYYRCDSTWYNRSYVNGTVSYVTVAPPPGY